MTGPRLVMVGSVRAAVAWQIEHNGRTDLGNAIVINNRFAVNRLYGVIGPLEIVNLHDRWDMVGGEAMAEVRERVHVANTNPLAETVEFVAPVQPLYFRDSNEMARDAAGPVIAAAFDGRCPECEGRIDEGDEIRMQHGRAVHDGCEE